MASISTDKKGNRRIVFVDCRRKRKAIYLGGLDMASVREIARRVEDLVASQLAGRTADRDLAEWLGRIGDVLHGKLVAAGLVGNRTARESQKLGAFLDKFIDKRDGASNPKGDVAPSTIAAMRLGAERLKEYFGEGTAIDAITAGQADDWLLWLATTKEYAPATIGRTVKRAKQFFAAAVRAELLEHNPFADLKAPGQTNEARKYFVTRQLADEVLEVCPDHEWRLIFALSRFGGLRCPSEHLQLTWSDINWARDRFRVRSAKTGERWVPIFPELRPHIDEAWAAAKDGAIFVLTRRRDSAQRWGMLLRRILAAAGITAWERIFHNLRASRQTELTAKYSIGTVCRWLGNSATIADSHYLMAQEEEFERAAATPHETTRIPTRAMATLGDIKLHERSVDGGETLENTQGARKIPEACKSQGGTEHGQSAPEKARFPQNPKTADAHSDARCRQMIELAQAQIETLLAEVQRLANLAGKIVDRK